MKKNKIMAIILSGAMIATMSGAVAHKNDNVNKIKRNNILLAEHNVSYVANACVINGNGNLVLTNKNGAITSYLSVGEMLKVRSVEGNRSLVTVEETGAKGYIDNGNKLNINKGNINNVTRMNRNGYIINVSNTVNLRKGPGMDYTILDGLTNNTSIRITGKTGQWYRVSVNGEKGYIFEEYVAETATGGVVVPASVTSQDGTTVTNTVSNVTSRGAKKHNPNKVVKASDVVKAMNKGIQHTASVSGVNETSPITNTQHAVKNNTVANNGSTTANKGTSHSTAVTSNTGSESTNKGTSHSTTVNNNNSGNTVVDHDGHHMTKDHGYNTPAKPSEHKPVPDSVSGKQGSVVVNKPVVNHNDNNGSLTGNSGAHISHFGNGGSTNVNHNDNKGTTGNSGSTVNHNDNNGNTGNKGTTVNHNGNTGNSGSSTIHDGSTNPKTPDHNMNPDSNKGGKVDHNTGNTGSTTNHNGTTGTTTGGSTIHKGSTNPATPDTNKGGTSTSNTGNSGVAPTGNTGQVTHNGGSTTPAHNKEVAPTVSAHNYKLIIGKDFSNSMLGAKANEGAKITYVGHVNNMKPGNNAITVVATNSEGTTSKVTVNVEVVDVAPTINAENYTMVEGGTFSNADLHISAHSQLGNNLTGNVKVEGNVDTAKAGTYKLTLTVKDQFGMSNTREVEVTVVKAPVKPSTPDSKPVVKPSTGGTTTGGDSSHSQTHINKPDAQHKPSTGTTGGTTTGGDSSHSQAHTGKPVAPHKNTGDTGTTTGGTTTPSNPSTVPSTGGDSSHSQTHINKPVAPHKNTGNTGTTTPTTKPVVKPDVKPVVKPSKPVVKPVVHVAPVLTIGNDAPSLVQGGTFLDSSIGATTTENATITYTGTVNTNEPGTYPITVTATNQYGQKDTKIVNVLVKAKPVVILPAPTITGHNATIHLGQTFNDSMLGASATVNGNPVQVTYSGNVNNEQKGQYTVTVTAKNAQGKEASEQYTVTVTDSINLQVQNYTMTQGGTFNVSDLTITATNSAGDNVASTATITSGHVNVNEPGTYNIGVTVNDGHGATAEENITVTVKAKPVAPIITASPETITQGQAVSDAGFHVQANQSGVQYSFITGNVHINTPGTYTVTIYGTNSQGLTGECTTTVTVKAKPVVEQAPVITAKNITITEGQTLNNSAFDASSNETNTTLSYDTSNVNTSIAGTYDVTIYGTNALGETGETTVTVTVNAPVVVNEFTPTGSNGTGTFTGEVPSTTKAWGWNHVSNVKAYVYMSQAYNQEVSRLVFQYINQFREANGLKAFTWSNDLAYMAQWKSNDCINHAYFTHKDLQGQYTNQVFGNQIKLSSWCENLAGGEVPTTQNASGQKVVTQTQVQEVAEGTFQAWKASPGHRANMLSNNNLGAVAVDGGVVTMEGATLQEGTFNPVTGNFTNYNAPASMQNPGPNVFTVVTGNK